MAIQVNIDTNEVKVGLDNVIYMEDGGHGIPVGGTTNQALIKNSSDNYDCNWKTIKEIPNGGEIGQVLKKASSADNDVYWATIQGGGGNTGVQDVIINSVSVVTNGVATIPFYGDDINNINSDITAIQSDINTINSSLSGINTALDALNS